MPAAAAVRRIIDLCGPIARVVRVADRRPVLICDHARSIEGVVRGAGDLALAVSQLGEVQLIAEVRLRFTATADNLRG